MTLFSYIIIYLVGVLINIIISIEIINYIMSNSDIVNLAKQSKTGNTKREAIISLLFFLLSFLTTTTFILAYCCKDDLVEDLNRKFGN